MNGCQNSTEKIKLAFVIVPFVRLACADASEVDDGAADCDDGDGDGDGGDEGGGGSNEDEKDVAEDVADADVDVSRENLKSADSALVKFKQNLDFIWSIRNITNDLNSQRLIRS